MKDDGKINPMDMLNRRNLVALGWCLEEGPRERVPLSRENESRLRGDRELFAPKKGPNMASSSQDPRRGWGFFFTSRGPVV